MRVKFVDKLLHSMRPSGTNVLLLMAIVVGATTALGALGFKILIGHANRLFFGMTDHILTNFQGGGGIKWWLPLIPMVGGLLVGPIVYGFSTEAKGHGVPEVMAAIARLGGIIRPRVAAAKAVASAICIGSGGSAGREGPIVQIGAALGSTIGQVFRMSGERVKILVGCGAAAGITSVFNAPIAGVLFSLEIILGDFAIKTFSPVLIASVVASVVTRGVSGNHPAFAVPTYSLISAWEVPMYMVMGLGMGVLSVLFTRSLDVTEDWFERFKVNNMLKPAIGGLVLGGVAFFFPQILADGYETIGLTLHGSVALQLLIPLIFLKILATSLTLGSGNSGGIFAPSLFMGAMAGGVFGHIVNYIFPTVTAGPGAYALVGMAGVVAGATHAPMTALLIIFEMTNDYRIILPLMLVVALSATVARKLFAQSIYTVKLYKRGMDIRGGRDINVLKSQKVSEIMDPKFQTINAATPLAAIFTAFEQSDSSYFLVVDDSDRLKGVLSMQDIRSLMSQHSLDYLVIAQDLVREETQLVHPEDELEKANEFFGLRDIRMLPVVAHDDSQHVLGVIWRDDLMNFYNRRLIEIMRQ